MRVQGIIRLVGVGLLAMLPTISGQGTFFKMTVTPVRHVFRRRLNQPPFVFASERTRRRAPSFRNLYGGPRIACGGYYSATNS